MNQNHMEEAEHHDTSASQLNNWSTHSDQTAMTESSPKPHLVSGHMLAMDDPENPMNWPLHRKLHACLMGFSFTFVLLFGATSYTSALQGVRDRFDVSMEKAIAGFAIYIFGIFFAPLMSPHISERLGRTHQYYICMFGNALFTLGAAYSQSYTSMMVCRFFAGFCGGPAAVLIEGTFADVWPALYTGTYYSALTCASYFGAGIGPIIGFPTVTAMGGDWRWTQFLTLIFSAAAFLIGIGVDETYGRKILRAQAKRAGRKSIPAAPTGETIAQMAKLTIVDPLIMLVSEPLVILISLFLALNFGVLFSWFIVVPVVLSGVYNFSPHMVGNAFTSAVVGTFMAFVSTAAIDQLTVRFIIKRKRNTMDIEHRMLPAMVGSLLLIASLFWIGFTAKPSVSYLSPIIGTAFYVWGSGMTLIAFVGYLFDAYPPQGIFPLVILMAIGDLTGAWALSVFGFIFVAFLPIPFVIFFFGSKLRAKSRYSHSNTMSPLQDQMMEEEHSMSQKTGTQA